MPNTVNQSHFAKMCGVSRQAISKAKANKPPLIKMIGKMVNLDHRITCEYFYTQAGRQLTPGLDTVAPAKKIIKPVPPPKPPRPPRKKPPIEPITAPVDDGEEEPEFDPDAPIVLPPGIESLDDINESNILTIQSDYLKKLKDLEAAKSSKQKREEALGLLIKRSTVRVVFAKLHTIDTNQWKTLEDRLAPGISGIFGFEEGCAEEVEVRRLINEEVAKTLRHEKRLLDDFLIKFKEVPL